MPLVEIVCLQELVKYYLKHPDQRQAVARRGQLRALRGHTYEKRIKEMLTIIEKNG